MRPKPWIKWSSQDKNTRNVKHLMREAIEKEPVQGGDWARYSKSIRAMLHKSCGAHRMPSYAPDTKHGVTVCNTHHTRFQYCFVWFLGLPPYHSLSEKHYSALFLSWKYLTFFWFLQNLTAKNLHCDSEETLDTAYWPVLELLRLWWLLEKRQTFELRDGHQLMGCRQNVLVRLSYTPFQRPGTKCLPHYSTGGRQWNT